MGKNLGGEDREEDARDGENPHFLWPTAFNVAFWALNGLADEISELMSSGRVFQVRGSQAAR